MFRIQLAQVNYQYGSNAYFPYSVGLLQSYLLNDSEMRDKVEFQEPIFLRKPFEEVLQTLDKTQLLGLSCYIWNWNYNLRLAKLAKIKYPKLKIVLGGPQVPNSDKDFLSKNSFIDFLIDQEGEIAFKSLVQELLKTNPDYSQVPSLRYLRNGFEVRNEPAKKIQNLDEVPSPYTVGIFNNLILENPTIQFQATQETHRGCPYSCTFCDWGSATMSKVRRFGKDRLIAEYQWFGENKIELLYNADANYGLFEEDIDLTRQMIETKRKFGYPKKFRAAYAKNSNERVFQIAQILEEEEMCKGITLSFQSMDSQTLELIKRRNMKVNNFRELITVYRQAKIPTYTELIIGLPGETYDSFKSGVETLLSAGQHDSLSIYHAMLLENAEMNDVEYRQLHGIKHQRIPLLLLHGNVDENDVTEYYDVVTETRTMSREDWIKTSVFAWGIQAFHCLNLTQSIAIALREIYNIEYGYFYEKMFSYFLGTDSYIGAIFKEMEKIARDVTEGQGSLDLMDRRYGKIMWPVEEILFLRAQEKNLWGLLRDFMTERFPEITDADREDLIKYQEICLRSKDPSSCLEVNLNSDWHTFLSAALENRKTSLSRIGTKVIRTRPVSFSSEIDYAREVVWYGRKGSSLREESLVSIRIE